MMVRILALFAIITTLLCTPVPANVGDDLDNVIIKGRVRDEQGAVIGGALVLVRSISTGVEKQSVTREDGQYRVQLSEPGTYSMRVSADGFKEQWIQNLELESGRVIALEITLIVAGADLQVSVAIESVPLIDTSRTVVGNAIGRKELDELPILNRDPLQLAFLLGGVTEAPLATSNLAEEGSGRFLRNAPEEAGLFSLTGAPATSNNLTIDGLDNNDDRSARERIALPPEALAEVQIISNQYAAEYGRASGGRINLRTRSGTQEFRGEAYAYFGDESLNANTYFRNARGLGRIPQLEAREGLVVSGPISRKQNFFLVSFERLDITDSEEIRATVPVVSNSRFPLPQPNQPVPVGSEVGQFVEDISTPENRGLLSVRSDFNFTASHNATVRIDLLKGANKRGFPGGNRLLNTLLVEGRNSAALSITDNYVLSASLIHQSRFQYSILSPRNRTASASVGVVIEEPERVIAGAFSGSDSAPAFAREETRVQVQDHLIWLVGPHQVKTGFDIQLVRSRFENLFATGGQYTFETVDDFLANRPSRFVQRFDTVSRIANDVFGIFAQDDWKLRSNLTFSYGIRWDRESIVRDRNNFSPRLAMAWDPFGTKNPIETQGFRQPGKTVIRAGFGIFYNRALVRTIDDFTLGRSTIIVDSNHNRELLAAIEFPQPLTGTNLIEKFGIKETEFLRRISPDLEIPYTLQSGMGIEREVKKALVVTADYIFTRGAHLWRESNINAPQLPAGFDNFTQYLLSRDFDNRRSLSGTRPIVNTNADLVRFDLSANGSTTSGALRVENGITVLTLGLNTLRSTNLSAALNAIRSLRPDPALTQVELLEASGNSFYHAGSFSARYSIGTYARVRAVYTLAKFIDEGTTNTASPQDLRNRRAERAVSLQDQRHRFTVSGGFQLPYINLELAPIISFGSSKPFTIGAGFDRNLNDISNDRPNFTKPIGRIEWRRPNRAPSTEVKEALQLAPLGSSGNLPRNYGRGPGSKSISLRASRSIMIDEAIKLRLAIDVFNIFNNTVFNFGSEFVDRDDADFLIPRRTARPRTIQLNLKITF